MATNKHDEAWELLSRVHVFLSNLCRDGRCDDHCSACIGASDLADDVYDLLHSPPRNCDVGTAEEQKDRFMEFCDDEKGDRQDCRNCRLCNACDCEIAWAQMPYTAEEGAGNEND